mmetsp:Transcript_844/g.3544  ORF Transcript_844/g.3544 Transcript_844/m.3544 type:complete len:128 (-) Transcript_844:35-418(-)
MSLTTNSSPTNLSRRSPIAEHECAIPNAMPTPYTSSTNQIMTTPARQTWMSSTMPITAAPPQPRATTRARGDPTTTIGVGFASVTPQPLVHRATFHSPRARARNLGSFLPYTPTFGASLTSVTDRND